MAIGLLGWTVNTVIIYWLTEYLGIKGINFNLFELYFGMHTMKLGDRSSNIDSKPKIFNSMDLDYESNTGKILDKGKGIEVNLHPNHEGNTSRKTGVSGGQFE